VVMGNALGLRLPVLPTSTALLPELERGFLITSPPWAAPGIRRVVNLVPSRLQPDGNPLVGPIKGCAAWILPCGNGRSVAGGGVQLSLANWMVLGILDDIWGMGTLPVRRLGHWSTPMPPGP